MVLAYGDICAKLGGHKLRLRDEYAKKGCPSGFTDQTMNSHQLNIRLPSRRKITDFHSGIRINAGN